MIHEMENMNLNYRLLKENTNLENTLSHNYSSLFFTGLRSLLMLLLLEELVLQIAHSYTRNSLLQPTIQIGKH